MAQILHAVLNQHLSDLGIPREVSRQSRWYYSPDFNPIEMAISKLKAALRKLAERTVAGLIAVLEGAADLFKRDECENYFQTCGYEPAELPLRDTT